MSKDFLLAVKKSLWQRCGNMSTTRQNKPKLLKARCETDLSLLVKEAAAKLGLDESAFIRSCMYQRSVEVLGRSKPLSPLPHLPA